LSPVEWESLNGGWARLILVMMWEESRPESRWGGYLRNMPREFDSPMFWGDSDRAELKGTDIEGGCFHYTTGPTADSPPQTVLGARTPRQSTLASWRP
jgi:hypothetical protein